MSTIHKPIKVALGSDFLSAYSRLPQAQQKKTREFCDKFMQNPTTPGTNFERINGARDANLRSVRIDQNYRGIVLQPERGDIYVLLWVDKHDEAYAWAERRICQVNPETGALQLFEASDEAPTPESGKASSTSKARKAERGIFDPFKDDELLALGVPRDSLTLVRSLQKDEDLDRAERSLPQDAFEAVYLLAAGYSLDEVENELGRKKPAETVDTGDFAKAIENEESKRSFIVLSDHQEMQKILAEPLAKWRIFLHPSQRRLVETNAKGPVRVLGGAGTGKTVVALHRARWLAEHVCKTDDRVFFTTFTKNLATDIQESLRQLCSWETLKKIEVAHLDGWAVSFLKKRGILSQPAIGDKADELWGQAAQLAPEGGAFASSFLREEWLQVVVAHGIDSLQDYFKASRAGRRKRLGRKEKQAIWPVFEEYRALLTEHGLRELGDIHRDVRQLLQREKGLRPYRSIVVDEAQDLGAEAFRLLRELSPAELGNDLFLVGDAHQRIYGNRVVLSQCGIEVRGRSRRLRINYRTTEETRRWASRILAGAAVDDLDGGVDDDKDYRSLTHGNPPKVQAFKSLKEEYAGIVQHVEALIENDQNLPEGICLVARTGRLVESYQKALQEAGLSTYLVKHGETDDQAKKGIRVATMHRVKGLEFDHVILAGMNESSFPPHKLDPDEAEDALLRERCLIHVAATRARKTVIVTSHGKMSGLIQ